MITAKSEKILRVFDDLEFSVLITPGDVSADFEVYQIVGKCEGPNGEYDKPIYEHWKDDAAQADIVENIEGASMFLHGSIKWDGCSNWHFDEQDRAMIHACSRGDLEDIGKIMSACFDLAKEFVKKFSTQESNAREAR
jgi:hypothetical protein